MTRMLVLVLAVLSFAADATAQKDLAKERVSLIFKDTPVGRVFQPPVKSLGYELTLDPTLNALVSIQVDNITAQTALNVLCESIGCRWRQEGKTSDRERANGHGDDCADDPERATSSSVAAGTSSTYAVRSLDEDLPFDITWSPTKVYYSFYMLARMMDADVDIAPALQDRKLAVVIKSATMRQAFDKICTVAGCRWEMIQQPRRLVRVTDAASRGQGALPASVPRFRE